MYVWLVTVHGASRFLQFHLVIPKQDARNPEIQNARYFFFIKLVCLLWIKFLQVAVETFENAVVDVRVEAWLQGQVDLLLNSGDSTVLNLAKPSQLN